MSTQGLITFEIVMLKTSGQTVDFDGFPEKPLNKLSVISCAFPIMLLKFSW